MYFPTGNSAKRQEDDFKLILPNNELKRLIYEGDVEYLSEEYELIDKFRAYLTQKEVFLGKQWSKAYVYKFLQSTGYDYKKSMKEIIAHDLYKE